MAELLEKLAFLKASLKFIGSGKYKPTANEVKLQNSLLYFSCLINKIYKLKIFDDTYCVDEQIV